MNPAVLNSQFVQIALPIMITFIATAWLNGRRIDDMNSRFEQAREESNRRFDEVILRLTRIEMLLPITISC